MALLHKSVEGRASPSPRPDLSYGLSDRHAKSRVAVQHGDTDLDLSNLPFKVPRPQRVAK